MISMIMVEFMSKKLNFSLNNYILDIVMTPLDFFKKINQQVAPKTRKLHLPKRRIIKNPPRNIQQPPTTTHNQ